MDKTRYLRKKNIDHALGKAAYAMPATVYLALFTANPTDVGLLTSEVAGGSYARQNLTTAMAAADLTTGIATNTALVQFPVPTADWGLITHGAIMDAAAAGNMLYFGALPAPRSLISGAVAIQFPVGTIQVKES